MDMAAIPDFSAGAMENWGLILYRETYLMHDEELSGAVNKETVTDVMAHVSNCSITFTKYFASLNFTGISSSMVWKHRHDEMVE